MSVCEYCGRPIVLASFGPIADRATPEVGVLLRALEKDPAPENLSALADFTKASCFLRLGIHDRAFSFFKSAIDRDPGNPEAYFYAAVCLLRGRKACLTPLAVLEKALRYIDAAKAIEPRGLFFYFAAYIKNDYFEKKCLRIEPDWRREMMTALENGLSRTDAERLFRTLGVPQPPALAF